MSVIVLGIEEAQLKLNEELLKIKTRTMQGLIDASIIVHRATEDQEPKTPFDTGNLRASWFTVTKRKNAAGSANSNPSFSGADAGKLASNHQTVVSTEKGKVAMSHFPKIAFGFSAIYSVYVHEMVDANFRRPGSGSHYFSSAIMNNIPAIKHTIKEWAKIR